MLGGLSLIGFLYLIDHAARMLRPVSILSYVAESGIRVIESVYPDPLNLSDEAQLTGPVLPPPARVSYRHGKSEIVLAVNSDLLVRLAADKQGVIEVAVRIGDFVATRQPLFKLHGGAAAITDEELVQAIAFGPERTLEQDATFAFRVIVDIGIKALSKAINDPTTAVIAIDQLQWLLTVVGSRNLHNHMIMDSRKQLRVILPTPNWEDFVELAVREIRLYGAENFQIARRLHAMLDSLSEVLPEARSEALDLERHLLDRMIEKVYLLPEDAATARIADSQGLGGVG